MKRIIILITLLFLLNCDERNIKKFNNLEVINFNKENNSNGILEIEFISPDEVTYENFSLKFQKEIPNTKMETNWVNGFPLPPLPIGKRVAELKLYEPDFQKDFIEISSKQKIQFKLPVGEFYASIEAKQTGLHFSINESKRILFFFGIKPDGDKFLNPRGKLILYDSECKTFLFERGGGIGNFGNCSKIKIEENKITNLRLLISKRESADFTTIFIKTIFPGFLILLPFSYVGGYFKRSIDLELINP